MNLKFVAITQMPLIYFTLDHNKSQIQGNLLDFPKILERHANISYTITQPKVQGWNYMLRALNDNEYDMSLTPVVQTQSSSSMVTFSKTIYHSSYVILSRAKHRKTEIDVMSHVGGIESYVWLMSLLSLAALLALIYLDRVPWHKPGQLSCWTIVTIMFPQNLQSHRRPSAVSSLVALYVLCFGFLVASFNAMIGVKKIVLKVYDEINSMEDIVRSESIVPAIYNSTSLETFLSKSKSRVHREIWSRIQSRPDLCLRVVPMHLNGESVGHDQTFYRALKTGNVVTFEPDYYSQLIRYDYCRFVPQMQWHVSPPLDQFRLKFAFGFRKGIDASIVVKIDDIIEKLTSAGILVKWFNDGHALPSLFAGTHPPPECYKDLSDRTTNHFIPINMANITELAKLLIISAIFSMLVLFIEYFLFYYFRANI